MAVVAGALALRGSKTCARCGYAMVLVGDEEVATMLDAGQKAEYDVGSVAWEIWHCANCANVERKSRVVEPAEYMRCQSCSYLTMPAGRRGVCQFCGNAA
jgi:hypothetical protein